MLSNNENAVLDGVGLDEEDLSIEDLLASFEADLELQKADLTELKEEYEKIGSPESLGSVVTGVIWDQFVNQVKTSLGAEAADAFIEGNDNLTLDLRNSAHIQTAENFAAGNIATHNHIGREQLEQNSDRFTNTPHKEFRKQYVDPGMNATLERAGDLKKKGIDTVTEFESVTAWSQTRPTAISAAPLRWCSDLPYPVTQWLKGMPNSCPALSGSGFSVVPCRVVGVTVGQHSGYY